MLCSAHDIWQVVIFLDQFYADRVDHFSAIDKLKYHPSAALKSLPMDTLALEPVFHCPCCVAQL